MDKNIKSIEFCVWIRRWHPQLFNCLLDFQAERSLVHVTCRFWFPPADTVEFLISLFLPCALAVVLHHPWSALDPHFLPALKSPWTWIASNWRIYFMMGVNQFNDLLHLEESMALIPSVQSLKSPASESSRSIWMSHNVTVMNCLKPVGQRCPEKTEWLGCRRNSSGSISYFHKAVAEIFEILFYINLH